jgi:hypothetical protein
VLRVQVKASVNGIRPAAVGGVLVMAGPPGQWRFDQRSAASSIRDRRQVR